MDEAEKLLTLLQQHWEQLDQPTAHALAGVSVLVFLFVAVALISLVVRARRNRLVTDQQEPTLSDVESETGPAPPPIPPPVFQSDAELLAERHIADIVQNDRLGGFGGFCVALMVLTWIISIVTFVVATTTFTQMIALLIWIGGNTMFGLGVLLDRKRTYRVYKPARF